ncbi:MAG: ROK family protein [Candidatus Omnitrophota bacterium]|nr:ROK family protein [Candidatus Omnitrophota bacterium]
MAGIKPKNFIIGIDLGGTNLKAGLVDLNYKIRYRYNLATRRYIQKEGLISAIIYCVNKIIQDNDLRTDEIGAIGIGLPGPVDPKNGIVHFLPNIPGWRRVRLKKILQNKLKLPVFLDNDVKLIALAEQKLGSAAGFKNSLCITLGTGVGGGLILEGSLYRGLDNAAGEIGHLPINEFGPRCNCGGRACLESYIGNKAILRRARREFGSGISLERLSKLAAGGNKKARRFWSKVAGHLGVALAGVVNLLNLDAVIIGGGVSGAGKILFDTVRKTIRIRAMSVQAGRVKVLRAKLGSDAGLIGAAILAREGLAR